MAYSDVSDTLDWEKAVVHDHSYPKMHMFHARKVMFSSSSRPLPTIYLFTNNTVEDARESTPKKLKLDPASSKEESVSEEEELDITSVDKAPDLPYEESKVRGVMVECEKYVSLVRLVAKHHHQEDMCVSVYYICCHN